MDNQNLENNVNESIIPNEELTNLPIRMSPIQIQQEYFENVGGYDWVKYEKSNRNYLLQNIAFALFGGPSIEGQLTVNEDNEIAHLKGYNSRQVEQVMKIYRKICEQSKYSHNHEDIMMAVILIVCARPKPLEFYQIQPSTYWFDLHERTDGDIWCTAVFKIRKCIPTTVGAKSCRVFIDEEARVYQDWTSYLNENTLPQCVITVPENGDYNGTLLEGEEGFAVNLTVIATPALGIKARIISTVDTTTTLASAGALGVLGVAAVTTVAPVALVGAAAVTAAIGAYGLFRSALHLRDRSTHEQPISPLDAEARGSWLNIGASSVGLAAGAASTLLTRSAAAGTNMTRTGRTIAVSVEVLRHANKVTGGAGVINSLLHIIHKYHMHGENPTTLEICQFTAATLFFYQAVVSNRTAQKIIEEAQTSTINEYRANLRSDRHREIFDMISEDTRQVQGTIQGNTEVIRNIKNIANTDQFFADAFSMNYDSDDFKLKISMTSDGEVNIQTQHKAYTSDLINFSQEEQEEIFRALGPPEVSDANVPTRIVSSATSIAPISDREDENKPQLVGIRHGEIIKIGNLLFRVSSSGAAAIAKMLQDLSKDLYADVMIISQSLLSKLIPEEIAKLTLLSTHEDLLTLIVRFVFGYIRTKKPFDNISSNDNAIKMILKEFFQEGLVRQDTILLLKEHLFKWIEAEMAKIQMKYPNIRSTICKTCKGVTYA